MNSFLQTIPGPISRPVKATDRSKNPLWRLRRFFFSLFVLGVLAMFALLAFFFKDDLPASAAEEAEASFLCLDTELDCGAVTAIAKAVQPDGDRDPVNSFDEIPDSIVHAVIATEDKDFYNHNGVNTMGIVRGVFQTVKSKATGSGSVQGGSSITQQLVKNQYLEAVSFNQNKSAAIARKPKEVGWAIKLERKLASEDLPCKANQSSSDCVKDEVLRRYLNTVPFGRGVNGIKAAARSYFDKDIADLEIEEAAFLAGALRAPKWTEPLKYPKEANRRINVSLDLMLAEGYITEQEKADAIARMELSPIADPETGVEHALPPVIPAPNKLGLGEVKFSDVGSKYFVDEVWQQVDEVYPGARNSAGLRVYTTMDPVMQTAAYETLTSYVKPDNTDMPNTGLVSVDGNGMVRALVGGFDYDEEPFNFATSRGSAGRQPGSLMKPIALAEAIEQGISAQSLYTAPRNMEIPSNYKGVKTPGGWKLKSGGISDGTYPNYLTLETATHKSTNSVYAQLMYDIKPEKFTERAYSLGLTKTIDLPGAVSNVLGSNSASVMDMASVYSTFERSGKKITPRVIQRIEDRDGNVLCWYPADGVCLAENTPNEPTINGEVAISSQTAQQVNRVLSGIISSGTGKKAQIGRPAAGKTGTTNSNTDAWFTGYTCDLTTSVWVGYDDNREMDSKTLRPTPRQLFGSIVGSTINGGDLPATMWGKYMKKAVANAPKCASLDVSSRFTGKINNPELDTNLDACGVAIAQNPVQVDPDSNGGVVIIPNPENGNGNGNNGNGNPNGNNGNGNQNGAVIPAGFALQAPVTPTVPQQTPQPQPSLTQCMVMGKTVDKRWVISSQASNNPLGPVITPVDPDPVEPVDPDPVDPVEPVDPDPVDPDPVDPDPVEPVDPDPVDPDPIDPIPVDPAPINPGQGKQRDIFGNPLQE